MQVWSAVQVQPPQGQSNAPVLMIVLISFFLTPNFHAFLSELQVSETLDTWMLPERPSEPTCSVGDSFLTIYSFLIFLLYYFSSYLVFSLISFIWKLDNANLAWTVFSTTPRIFSYPQERRLQKMQLTERGRSTWPGIQFHFRLHYFIIRRVCPCDRYAIILFSRFIVDEPEEFRFISSIALQGEQDCPFYVKTGRCACEAIYCILF